MARSSGCIATCLGCRVCPTGLPVLRSPNPILRCDHQLAILSGGFAEPFLGGLQRLPGPIIRRVLRFKNMDTVFGGSYCYRNEHPLPVSHDTSICEISIFQALQNCSLLYSEEKANLLEWPLNVGDWIECRRAAKRSLADRGFAYRCDPLAGRANRQFSKDDKHNPRLPEARTDGSSADFLNLICPLAVRLKIPLEPLRRGRHFRLVEF